MIKNTLCRILLLFTIPVIAFSQPVINNSRINPASRVIAETQRYLVLRVEFVADELATTTGDGTFDLGTESDYYVDSPPHNRTYFQHQMLALKNYFSKISNNNLVIEADVYPEGENESYQLPENMVYYSGQENDSLKNVRWSALLRDALNLARQQDNPDFSQYDGVFVFHAGVGNDFAFDFDDTPYDIQSVYLDLETLRNALGNGESGYQGIDMGNGVFIKDGIILPEAQSQEGYDLGLLGTMTLLTGSKLGMPNLFNTETGDAGIGRWGLMDQGSYNLQGLIPAYPCAWMKVYMGWEEPVVVTSGKDLKIGAVNTVNTAIAPHIYKIPITATEYYLIENRQIDSNGDHLTFGRDEYGNRAQFDTLGNVTADADLKVITRVDEYDFGLPGSGLLIWHINESVIQAKLASNTINNMRDNRGVDLIECDGAQDIGYFYGDFSSASGTESGDYYDPYWSGNESHMYVNNETDTVALAPNTIPASLAHDGSATHIHIYDISANDTVMTFSVKNDRLLDRLPMDIGPDYYSGSLVTVQRGDSHDLVALSGNGSLFGWSKDGPIIQAAPAFYAPIYPLLTLEDDFNLPPAAADIDGDGIDELFLLSTSGILTVVGSSTGAYQVMQSVELDVTPTAGPMVVDTGSEFYIMLGTQDGKVLSVTFNPELEATLDEAQVASLAVTGLSTNYPHGNSVAMLGVDGQDGYTDVAMDVFMETDQLLPGDTNNITDLMGISPDGSRAFIMSEFYKSGGGTLLWATTASGQVGSITLPSGAGAGQALADAPALGDVDGDGITDIIVQYNGNLHVYNHNLTPVTNFPIKLTDESYTGQAQSPVFLQTETEGPVIINALTDGGLVAHNRDGDLLPGYPLTAGNAVNTTPIVFKWSDSDANETDKCAVIDSDGFLYIWDLDLTSDAESSWRMYGGDKYNRFMMVDQDANYETNETALLPKQSAYCYPNPAYDGYSNIRYRLTRQATEVSVRIYDLAGDLVTELDGTGITAGDHEIRWDVSNIQSGAYLARIQVSDGSETAHEFIKIAVIK